MVVLSDVRPTAAPVLVAFDAPTDQRRITVAARLVLALPHVVALGVLGVGALVVVVVGWFGALVKGRLPGPVAEFLSGYLRWLTRVYAYLFLLTDVYPPFSLHDAAFPVRVTTQPGPLNRVSVGFRLVLAVPALLVAATVTYGSATVVLIATWLVVLVTGRLPSSMHQVFSAFVRYQARLNGYLTMVTSQYPWGLLGDAEPDTAVASAGWQPGPPLPVHDPYWQVVLTARAKNLVVFVLVLGVVSVVGVDVAHAVSRMNQISTEEAAGARVQGAYQTLSGAVVGYETETRSCDGTVQPVTCLTDAAATVSEAFTVFVRRVSDTTMPGPAAAARARLVWDGAHAQKDFALLSASTSPGHYQLLIETSNLPKLLIRFDQDYEALGTQLNNFG